MRRHPYFYSFLFIFLFLFFLGGVFVSLFFIFSGSAPTVFSGGEVAVLVIEGPIFDSSKVLRKIESMRNDKSVKAVVVRIDSPGGAVAPSQEIFGELKKLKNDKKIVVSMGTVAASGGYYIALAADKIIASKGTITGSIGVIMKSMSVAQLVKWARLESRVVKSGKFKDSGSPFRPISEDEKIYFQGLIDNMYEQFVGDVASERHMPLEKLKTLADGRVYTGEQALNLGLIDGLGNLYDALDEAKKMAGLPQSARVIWPNEFDNPWEIFLRGAMGHVDFLDEFINRHFNGFETPVWFYMMNMDNFE